MFQLYTHLNCCFLSLRLESRNEYDHYQRSAPERCQSLSLSTDWGNQLHSQCCSFDLNGEYLISIECWLLLMKPPESALRSVTNPTCCDMGNKSCQGCGERVRMYAPRVGRKSSILALY